MCVYNTAVLAQITTCRLCKPVARPASITSKQSPILTKCLCEREALAICLRKKKVYGPLQTLATSAWYDILNYRCCAPSLTRLVLFNEHPGITTTAGCQWRSLKGGLCDRELVTTCRGWAADEGVRSTAPRGSKTRMHVGVIGDGRVYALDVAMTRVLPLVTLKWALVETSISWGRFRVSACYTCFDAGLGDAGAALL